MYTVLTTCPDFGSRNVGDKLIEVRLRELIHRELGEAEFFVLFREEPLDDHLEKINSSKAILLPAFPIRDTPIHPGTYRLVGDLDRIKVPMIPVGSNWNTYPGDAWTRSSLRYSDETTSFLKRIASQNQNFSCREYFACEILKNHGVTNTVMTGDPAMFRETHFGKSMHRPSSPKQIVFSPPLSPFYADQALRVMKMLADLFPDARKLCAFHLADPGTSGNAKSENSAAMTSDVGLKNKRVREAAATLGFNVLELAGSFDNMLVYDDCDLHVGYECHAHLYFMSMRRPSILIAEDARGVGFNYTLGVGGFNGFARAQYPAAGERKSHTSGYCTTVSELAVAPPRMDVHIEIGQFLAEECASGFRRYLGVPDLLDELYETAMKPLICSLPV